MPIPTLADVVIRPGGAGLTITGRDEEGQQRRFTMVAEVRQTLNRVGYFAIDAGGGRIAKVEIDD